jgi:atypical dual specificity phosphatase
VTFNFSWIIPDRVGGMAHPRPEDLERLREIGVTAILSLTPWPPEAPEGMRVLHVPVPDMHAPTVDQLHQAVAFMQEIVRGGGKVVAHCTAGMGRTGTFLAAYLVSEGRSPRAAMEEVRRLRPGSIETDVQEEAVFLYAELIGADPE